jgi:cell division protein FtsX
MKVLGVFIGLLVAVAALNVAIAYPLMLVLGALHSSTGLAVVPALGFWQTLGSLFVIGCVASACKGVSVNAKK